MSKGSIACIAFKGKQVLIAHRNPTGQMGGRWEFPGGKVEDGETDETAIVREMGEEFGITVTPVKKIAEAEFKHNGKISSLHAYLVTLPHDGMTEKYTLTEHTDYRWADLSEIPLLNFVDSDMLLYPQVVKYLADSLGEAQA